MSDQTEQMLDGLQRATFEYFLNEANPNNGLVPDSTRRGSPSSICAVGFALASYAVAVERGYISREDALGRTLATLRFFHGSSHGPQADATGYHGFYYHFLDMGSGRRAWRCELSTIDTTFLLAGALAAAAYFNLDTPLEREVRSLAHDLYARVDWQWASNGGPTVTHGWWPESGFLPYRWEGYNEALILYVMGLGSPTHPLPPESYAAWTSTYRWKKLYGYEFIYAGSLFIHQFSHFWLDFRGIQDEYMRARGIDYFENSRRATYVQQGYAIRNPREFVGYGEHSWGITASDGPGPAKLIIDGKKRIFYDYRARSVPFGPDDGTLSHWAVAGSLPFAPEIVLPTLEYYNKAYRHAASKYGFKCSFNPTFRDGSTGDAGWVSPYHFGLDQGPVILQIENYRSGLLWQLMKTCPYVVTGLLRAGFTGGWLRD
jgi:hypothetical protein